MPKKRGKRSLTGRKELVKRRQRAVIARQLSLQGEMEAVRKEITPEEREKRRHWQKQYYQRKKAKEAAEKKRIFNKKRLQNLKKATAKKKRKIFISKLKLERQYEIPKKNYCRQKTKNETGQAHLTGEQWNEIVQFMKNKFCLESLHQRYEIIRELLQERNWCKSDCSPSEVFESTVKLAVESTKMAVEGRGTNCEAFRMDGGFDLTDELCPLQKNTCCKICSFVGQGLVKHYVEHHPCAEIPVHLTPEELNILKNNAETSVQLLVNSPSQEDRIETVINFLNNLEPTNTFTNTISCPLCSYSSLERSDIISHLLVHETSDLKCYFCLKTETNLNDFRDHVSSHTGEYAYKCIHCAFRGVSAAEIARHICQDHPGEDVKAICENVFIPDSDCLKGYVCSMCGFIQMTELSVKKHISCENLSCQGSYVIELDLSIGRKGSSSATTINGSCVSNESQSPEYIVPTFEEQADKSNGSILNRSDHTDSVVPSQVYIQDEIEIAPPNQHPHSIIPSNVTNFPTIAVEIKTERRNEDYYQTNLQFPSKKADSEINCQMPVVAIKNEKRCDGYNLPNLQFEAQNSSNILSYHNYSVNMLSNSSVKELENLSSKIPNAQPLELKKIVAKGVATVENSTILACALCQFSTLDEALFIKHVRTSHREDLSLWCKKCDKCFSTAALLVSHIKEGSCIKEYRIYRCGINVCTFQTLNGQIFVLHLRNCQNIRPFVNCAHCQEGFTSPHCLILHMQNDCPYRDKDRLYLAQSSAIALPISKPGETYELSIRPASTFSNFLKPSISSQSIVIHTKPDVSGTFEPSGKKRWNHKGNVTGDSCESGLSDSLPHSSLSAKKENYYFIAQKKPGDKIGCLICNLKFDHIQNFLDHFVLHKKESAAAGSVKSDELVQAKDITSQVKNELGKIKMEPQDDFSVV